MVKLQSDLLIPAEQRIEVPQELPGPPLLRSYIQHLRTKMHLPDYDHVLNILAAAVNATDEGTERLWITLVGSSSGGKTEALRTLPADYQLSDVASVAALLSWDMKAKPRKAVGMLTKLPPNAIVVYPDFSSLLEMGDNSGRDLFLSALRRIHDGSYERDINPETLEWEGRLVLISCVTEAIDRYSSVTQSLGPRWLLTRVKDLGSDGRQRQAHTALRAGEMEAFRATGRTLATAVIEDARRHLPTIELSDRLTDWLVNHSLVVCYGRAAVPRSGYGKREVLGLPDIEDPPRMVKQLGELARCLLAMDLDEATVARHTRAAALDSLPRARLRVLDVLADASGPMSGSAIARAAGLHKNVAAMTLEDLAEVGVLPRRYDEEEATAGRRGHPWDFDPGDVGQAVAAALRTPWETTS